LLWDRLTGRAPLTDRDGTARGGPTPHQDRAAGDGDTVVDHTAPATGWTLVLAVFGIIAIIVGLQGLFTPN
jgi:hypothetical protein